MLLLLQCPECHNRMKYESRDRILSNKIKECVYCGRSFKVKNHIIPEANTTMFAEFK